MKINERIVRVAIEFAKLSIHLVPKDESSSRLAIEMAEKYLRGEVSTREEVKAVASTAYAVATNAIYTAYAAARTTSAATRAANFATHAAANAAYAAADAAHADVAAADAADAIAYASRFKRGTKKWHLKRLGVLEQCLIIAKRTFGLIR